MARKVLEPFFAAPAPPKKIHVCHILTPLPQDTIVAIKRGGTSLSVTSPYPDVYPPMSFDISFNQEVDTANHSWANYFVVRHGHTPAMCGREL